MAEKEEAKRPEWMTSISANVKAEDYLLGRKVDKTFELSQQEKADKAREARIELIANDRIKLTHDPIIDLERRRRELKMELISNPVKLKQFRERLLQMDRDKQASSSGDYVETVAQHERLRLEAERDHSQDRTQQSTDRPVASDSLKRPSDFHGTSNESDHHRDHEHQHHDRSDPSRYRDHHRHRDYHRHTSHSNSTRHREDRHREDRHHKHRDTSRHERHRSRRDSSDRRHRSRSRSYSPRRRQRSDEKSKHS